ncbi:hypothetical protein [Cellulophaga tyrosinoxydans]|uniref:Fasciclin domain-containing protein n=1 Tax=Cellulophaga tyrosinoxydans TaxID=504486 RepID=A0A1W2C356_9FLAO|nr:hypothetical protein [Cellulophaga tyrosinoxydans]SMC79677.1 hypothetical protein SAMN05660703_2792 [Cellulophaga tyrosinoxydans]
MKTYIKILLATCMVATLGSCSLDLQEQFNYKGETYSEEDPFENITAWDYIQSRVSNTPRDANNRFKLQSNTNELGFNGDELDLMIAAIKRVGYEDLYNQTANSGRTYLLLNNNAFTGNNSTRDIVRAIRGSQLADNSTIEPETYFDNWTPEQLNQLKAILRYHIVTDYVEQRTVPTANVFVLFKTLLPKVNLDALGAPVSLSNDMADIAFSRDGDARFTLRVNDVGSPLPATANTANLDESVRRHNYVFNNGIGHYLQEMVRYQPYTLYTNLPLD